MHPKSCNRILIQVMWLTDETIFHLYDFMNKVRNFGFQKTHICVKHDYYIHEKLPFGLHDNFLQRKAPLAPFLQEMMTTEW